MVTLPGVGAPVESTADIGGAAIRGVADVSHADGSASAGNAGAKRLAPDPIEALSSMKRVRKDVLIQSSHKILGLG